MEDRVRREIIRFAAVDSFHRSIYYFIRLSVVSRGPSKNLLHRKGQRRLIYCSARVTLAVFITNWINRSVPRCYDIRRATFEQETLLPTRPVVSPPPVSRDGSRGLSIFESSSLFVESNRDRTETSRSATVRNDADRLFAKFPVLFESIGKIVPAARKLATGIF